MGKATKASRWQPQHKNASQSGDSKSTRTTERYGRALSRRVHMDNSSGCFHCDMPQNACADWYTCRAELQTKQRRCPYLLPSGIRFLSRELVDFLAGAAAAASPPRPPPSSGPIPNVAAADDRRACSEEVERRFEGIEGADEKLLSSAPKPARVSVAAIDSSEPCDDCSRLAKLSCCVWGWARVSELGSELWTNGSLFSAYHAKHDASNGVYAMTVVRVQTNKTNVRHFVTTQTEGTSTRRGGMNHRDGTQHATTKNSKTFGEGGVRWGGRPSNNTTT